MGPQGQHDLGEPVRDDLAVSAAGSHVVEYRSKDKAGNTEATKSVAFSIAAPAAGDSEDADVNADVPLMMSISSPGRRRSSR